MMMAFEYMYKLTAGRYTALVPCLSHNFLSLFKIPTYYGILSIMGTGSDGILTIDLRC